MKSALQRKASLFRLGFLFYKIDKKQFETLDASTEIRGEYCNIISILELARYSEKLNICMLSIPDRER